MAGPQIVSRQQRLIEPYTFAGPNGPASLQDLFGSHRQLVIHHFVFDPDWEESCRSFHGIGVHLAARDVAFAAISPAPFPRLMAFHVRMNWDFPWYSSHGTSFDQDFRGGRELPGISVFAREGEELFHTHACYVRGLEPMNAAGATQRCSDSIGG
jgi:predicted dithiol-disulfide oxidoreductase (DUF899 family)